MRPVLYTIGYAPHEPEGFLELLVRHGVSAVADVRSSPYSAYKKVFSRPSLQRLLPAAGLAYVHLEELGPRRMDWSVLVDGRADYELIALHPEFLAGLDRLRTGMARYSVALMCAEGDPLRCHRAILICRQLRDEVAIRHILPDGSLEDHAELERRLVAAHLAQQAEQHTLPGFAIDPARELAEAYRRQGMAMAWRMEIGQPDAGFGRNRSKR